MNEQRFPKGGDEQRVQRLIADLDSRTDEEWIAADEAAAADGGDQAVITVPATLQPEIRRLLAAHKTASSPINPNPLSRLLLHSTRKKPQKPIDRRRL